MAVVRSNSAGFGPGRRAGGAAYRREELVGVLRNAGLAVLRSSYVNGLPALAQEVRGRWMSGGRPHPSGGGLRIDLPSARVNRLMTGVSALERRAMEVSGLPLPFGHSTLALAMRSRRGN